MKQPPDPCTPLLERAAIMEFCAGLTRSEAERKARLDVETYEARLNPQQSLFRADGKAAR